MAYPEISDPRRQSDGTYLVIIERARGDWKEVTYPDKATAERGLRALKAGAELLVAEPPKGGPGGNPGKLTPGVKQRLVAAAKKGHTGDVLADVAGVHRSTLAMWMAKGRKAKRGRYRELLEALTRARSKGEDHLVELIDKQAVEDWRAAAWRLECWQPDRYGKKRRLELTGADGGPVQVSADDALGRLEALLEGEESTGEEG